jgi:hypothetical protein
MEESKLPSEEYNQHEVVRDTALKARDLGRLKMPGGEFEASVKPTSVASCFILARVSPFHQGLQ